MYELRRQRALRLGRVDLVVTLPERQAASLTDSGVYRHVLRPGLRVARWPVARRHRQLLPPPHLVPARAPRPEDVDQEAIRLIQEVAGLDWRQGIHVGHGVVTPGAVNHLGRLGLFGLPKDLSGRRCLDVSAGDGFWAFEMERRGATDTVVMAPDGTDRDRARACFDVAGRLLGSKARWLDEPIQGREELGPFDIIVVDDRLGWGSDPQSQLETLYASCRGQLVLVEPFDPRLERYGDAQLAAYSGTAPADRRQWTMNVGTLSTMLLVAGFRPVDEVARYDTGQATCVVLRADVPAHNSWSLYMGGDASQPGEPEANPEESRTAHFQLGPAELVVTAPSDLARRVTPLAPYRLARRLLGPRGTPPSREPQSGNAAGGAEPGRDPTPATGSELAARVAELEWYHTIDLGQGVVTKGFVDHRAQVGLYGLPDSLDGLRCLDVATFDGFWAFEMERRGAAEVVATDIAYGTDIDLPRQLKVEMLKQGRGRLMGSSFRFAHATLESHVEHRICSVYDLSPERLGTFDLVFVSDLLLHLRDPQLALRRMASVCHGTLVVGEVHDPALERQIPGLALSAFRPWLPNYTWWIPSVETLHAMLAVAGFTEIDERGRWTLATGDGFASKVAFHASGPAPRQRPEAAP